MTAATRNSLFIALAGFVISLVLFFPAYDAGRVQDFTGFFLKMRSGTFADALGSFDYNIVQPVLQSFNLLLFKISGRSGLAYFFIFHVLFGVGLFAWSKFIFEISKSKWLPVLILLAFALNPYIVEVLVYKVCQAYLLSFIFLGFYQFYTLQFLKHGGKRNFFILLVLLLAQMWTFDFILVYPLLTMLLLGLVSSTFKSRKWIYLLLVNLAIMALYFLENKIALGSWVGHYGSEVHFSIDLMNQLATCIKYYMKHLGLCQFFSYPVRHQLYGYVHHWLAMSGFVLMSIFGLYKLFKYRNKESKYKIIIYFLLASAVILIPVSNLSFQDLMLTENDRYGFLFGLCLISGVITLLYSIPNKALKWGLIVVFMGAQLFTQQKLIRTWVEGQQIVENCMNALPDETFDPSKIIYLLNLPDNYHGVYLFKNLHKESKLFQETYIAQVKDTSFADLKIVAQMNMVGIEDGAKVVQNDDFTYSVDLNQYGTWWWRNGLGAYTYETPDYSMQLNGLTYTLTYKKEKMKSYIWDNSKWNVVTN